MTINPVLVKSIRGDLVENQHRGSYAVITAEGDLIAAAGDFRKIMFARSSLKPIQVLAILEAGAADYYHLSSEEIALGCSSHSGEIRHVELLQNWLTRIGLSETDLDCGVHSPLGRESAKALYKSGGQPTCLHNSCSGKHAALLTLTKFLQAPLKGYTDLGHPCQVIVNEVVRDMTETDINIAPKGTDGCQIPLVGMELRGIALAMAKLVDPKALRPSLKIVCRRVVEAMQEHPFLVGGTNRFCTNIMEKTKGEVLMKMGAGGIFAAAIPRKKWGIALKIDDGHTQAAEVAMITLLKQLNFLPKESDFTNYLEMPLHNWNRQIVGKLCTAL